LDVITTDPDAIASINTIPKPSHLEGTQNTSDNHIKYGRSLL
jgi:hypothetical protein